MLLNSEKVRDLRHGRGWTQEQLAELAGVSVRTIQRLEKTGVASLETTSALAAVMEVERETLLVVEGTATGHTDIPRSRVIWVILITFALGILVGLSFRAEGAEFRGPMVSAHPRHLDTSFQRALPQPAKQHAVLKA